MRELHDRGRRIVSTGLAAVGAAFVSLAAAPASALAVPSAPMNLTVGGDGSWQTSDYFRLEWENPPPSQGLAIAAVHYRIRNSLGGIALAETRIPSAGTEVIVQVPSPDSYKAEVWLEDVLGSQGTAATATLRYDNIHPGEVEPVQPVGWVGRTAFPYTIRLNRPKGQMPASGISGYAVSVDRVPNASPCAIPSQCTKKEIDLQGGVEDTELTENSMLAGTNYVHAMAVSGAGLTSTVVGQAIVRVDAVDPVTHLAGLPSGWANLPVSLAATATDSTSGMESGQGVGPFTAIQIDGGAPVIEEGGSVTATVIAEGVHLVAYYARDAAGNVNDGDQTNGIDNFPPLEATVRIDRTSPVVSFNDAQDPSDPELIQVDVGDGLSGPDLSRGWIGVRRAGSGERFEALPVQAKAGHLEARWDSDAYPAGRYEFRATGYDVAGNQETTGARTNGQAMVLANPLKAPTTLTAWLVRPAAGSSRCRVSADRCPRDADRPVAELLVPFDRQVVLAGKLVVATGVSTGGMPIRIVERFSPGSNLEQRVSTVATGPDGAFTFQLAPGPSREVTASFAGMPAMGRSAAPDTQLKVSGKVELRVSAAVAKVGGRPVIFTGSVTARGCPIPSNGKSVQLQFRVAGQPWTEFRTVQTDRRGNFRYAYRFSDDDSRGVRFQFRAFAPAQSDWPYEPGGSRPVAVHGA